MKERGRIWNLLLIVPVLFIVACSEGSEMEAQKVTYKKLNDVPDSVWDALSIKKIYFGHQSVGFNIIDGVQELMKEYPKIKMNILETTDSRDFDSGVFAHSKIGKNREPQKKINEFAENINAGIGNKADYAFFKFCYVDFPPSVDFNQTFESYKLKMLKLKSEYPNTTFVHFTVPIVAQRDGWLKSVVKKFLDKNPRNYADNVKRAELNKKIREEYARKEPLFDLASVESTLPDGTRISFQNENQKIYALAMDYTDDGAHLNAYGRKVVAEQFLLYLAKLTSNN